MQEPYFKLIYNYEDMGAHSFTVKLVENGGVENVTTNFTVPIDGVQEINFTDNYDSNNYNWKVRVDLSSSFPLISFEKMTDGGGA